MTNFSSGVEEELLDHAERAHIVLSPQDARAVVAHPLLRDYLDPYHELAMDGPDETIYVPVPRVAAAIGALLDLCEGIGAAEAFVDAVNNSLQALKYNTPQAALVAAERQLDSTDFSADADMALSAFLGAAALLHKLHSDYRSLPTTASLEDIHRRLEFGGLYNRNARTVNISAFLELARSLTASQTTMTLPIIRPKNF